MATLRATKSIPNGKSVLTCYRNTSSGGTSIQLEKEKETLNRMFICECCLCTGQCRDAEPLEVSDNSHLGSASMDRASGSVDGGPDTPIVSKRNPKQCGLTPEEQGTLKAGETVGPTGSIPSTTTRLPTPMQLVWTSAADKRKGSRYNPIGVRATKLQGPRKAAARTSADTFFKPTSRPSFQSPQASQPSLKSLDVRSAVLHDSDAGEFLYIESIYTGQPIIAHAEGPIFEFAVSDFAYPLRTSSVARLHQGANRPSGYLSLTGTNWVCGETVTSTLHIIARAEGWGLQAMPPQPGQTVWIGPNSYWSKNLLTEGSGRSLTDPALDAGVTGAFFGKNPKQIKHANHHACTALFQRALQVKTVYVPFNIHSFHWVYFRVDLDSNTVTLHDPLPPRIQLQAKDTEKFLHRLAEWLSQVKHDRLINGQRASKSLEVAPAFMCHLTCFRTITSITQRDGFQCAIFCIGNIAADAANKQGRVRHQNCDEIRKYVGLLLWLDSQQPIALSLAQQTALFGLAPSGAVLRVNDSPQACFRPRPLSWSFIEVVIRNMIREIGDNSPVNTAPILLDWAPTIQRGTSDQMDNLTSINEEVVYIPSGSPGPQNGKQDAGEEGVQFLNLPADAEATHRTSDFKKEAYVCSQDGKEMRTSRRS